MEPFHAWPCRRSWYCPPGSPQRVPVRSCRLDGRPLGLRPGGGRAVRRLKAWTHLRRDAEVRAGRGPSGKGPYAAPPSLPQLLLFGSAPPQAPGRLGSRNGVLGGQRTRGAETVRRRKTGGRGLGLGSPDERRNRRAWGGTEDLKPRRRPPAGPAAANTAESPRLTRQPLATAPDPPPPSTTAPSDRDDDGGRFLLRNGPFTAAAGAGEGGRPCRQRAARDRATRPQRTRSQGQPDSGRVRVHTRALPGPRRAGPSTTGDRRKGRAVGDTSVFAKLSYEVIRRPPHPA